MPALVVVFIVKLFEVVCKQLRQTRATKPRPLCIDCTYAHVQYAVNGRRAIGCTFAGTLRSVLLDVMYCTDYRDRNVPARVVSVGFVREIAAAQVSVEAATSVCRSTGEKSRS